MLFLLEIVQKFQRPSTRPLEWSTLAMSDRLMRVCTCDGSSTKQHSVGLMSSWYLFSNRTLCNEAPLFLSSNEQVRISSVSLCSPEKYLGLRVWMRSQLVLVAASTLKSWGSLFVGVETVVSLIDAAEERVVVLRQLSWPADCLLRLRSGSGNQCAEQ